MRNPHNNPTDRILRLLSEYDDLKYAYEHVLTIAHALMTPAAFERLPAVSHTEFEKELQRQGGNYTRLRNSVLAQRGAMNRRRLTKTKESPDFNGPNALPDLSVDEISKMIKEIK